jgi:hypothetical protein
MLNDMTEILKAIIRREFKYWVPQRGQVKSVNDPEGLGRIKVTVPVLGWTTENQGVWAKPAGQAGLITPAQNDWVMVQFINGRPEDAIWIGTLPAMKGSEPSVYENQNTQVLFEDPDEQIALVFDQVQNVLQIGKTGFSPAARQEDTIISSTAEDAAFWGWLSGFISVFQSWVPVPSDGGAALKAALTAYLGANPTPTEMAGKIDSGSDQVEIGDA